ncbi:MAG: ABC-F family ATP-binding cassette domain-containing protein, partial [Pseudobutyrivibrio sp.]|nr:ABC-F family ATP-binding cassette domain-containing protein [Pseudobutyrivibrio sp.]
DEPTNHLDMDSKQMLEEALNEYDGTLLYVSHDRYFVNKTANIILELSNGGITKYLGNYDDYIAKKEQLGLVNNVSNTNSVNGLVQEETASKLDFKEQKRIEAEKRKLQNRISKIEEEIEALENEKAKIDEEFVKPENMTNSAKLNELTAKQNEIDAKLDTLYQQWEEISSL